MSNQPKYRFKIPVVWMEMGYVTVEMPEDDTQKAFDYAVEHADEFRLPSNAEYLDGSFEIDTEGEAIKIPDNHEP